MIIVTLLRSVVSLNDAREHIAAYMRASMNGVAEHAQESEVIEGKEDKASLQTLLPPRVFEETVAHGMEKILTLKDSGDGLDGEEFESWSASLLAAATHVEAGLACSAFTFSHVIAAWGTVPADIEKGNEVDEAKEEEGQKEGQDEEDNATAAEAGEEAEAVVEMEEELPVQSKIALSLLSMARKVLLESQAMSELAGTAGGENVFSSKLREAISMSCECLGRIVIGDKIARKAAQNGEHEDCCVDVLLNMIKTGAGGASFGHYDNGKEGWGGKG